MAAVILVCEKRRELAFSFDEMLRYNGGGAPGGVAHAFKALERGLPLLEPGGPPERREIAVATAFGGPGARDAFELVARAVSGGRYLLDQTLTRQQHGRPRERFVFRLGYGARSVTLTLRDGFVSSEFVELAARDARSSSEELRLEKLKAEMADRLMASSAADVYAVEPPSELGESAAPSGAEGR